MLTNTGSLRAGVGARIKRNENLNTRLTNALKDSNPMLKVAYTSDEIEQIRKTVKGKGYRITNSLNKNITKEW